MTDYELKLPQLQIMFHVKHGLEAQQNLFHVKHEAKQSTNLVLAGGREPDLHWLSQAAKNLPVYCADKGAETALKAGLLPILLVGDCDSAVKEVYTKIKALGTKVAIHTPEKDDTDLQLLLQELPEGNLLVSGIWGGRYDHLFSNVYSLLNYKQKRHCSVVMADEKEIMLFLEAGEAVELALESFTAVQALSLLPLEDAQVSLSGVHWPLANATIERARPYSISNLPVQSPITCSCSHGCVGLYLHWD